ncbi:aminotransferase class IV [Hymenobacter sp. NST-14]|uniref:aminotransferase class IV n=1 Tax=Hymenobacter piscis TaxID=2839984 RepID=UPI001C017228|nr:aminotransferase class IV [Hymenobacter piscis]MBT9394201.1 aminotransferase class IV [Hymenobacter piscis]
MMVLYNGGLLPANAVRLALPNRGLFFNDGFFETLVWADGRLRYLTQHWNRMQRAAAALGLVLPGPLATPEALTATLARLVAAQPAPAGPQRLRLQLWRSGGGLYAPATSAAEWLATAQPFAARETPVESADFAATVRTACSPVSFCKGPNALLYVLAAREREQRGLEEILLLSAEGYVAEAGAAAVAWIRDGAVWTPAETAGGVAGTRLAHLRAAAEKLALPWHAGLYEPAALLAAEAVFTANVAGIRPVLRVGEATFASDHHPVLRALRAAEQRLLRPE